MAKNIAVYDVGVYDYALYDTAVMDLILSLDLNLSYQIYKRLVYPRISSSIDVPKMSSSDDIPIVNKIHVLPKMSNIVMPISIDTWQNVPKISL